MGSLLTILTLVSPILAQVTSIVSRAIAASATGDQATLDDLHEEAVALANSLRPAGSPPVS